MNDYLEKICITLGIKLVYTNNKIVILSTESKNGLSVLRAHKLFKNCPLQVAQAIMGYYTNENNKTNFEKVILDYVNQLYPSNSFKIKDSFSELKQEVIKKMPVKNKASDTSFIEFDISSLVIRDFWGNERKANSDTSIEPQSNDFLELNIVIKPPVT